MHHLTIDIVIISVTTIIIIAIITITIDIMVATYSDSDIENTGRLDKTTACPLKPGHKISGNDRTCNTTISKNIFS